MATAWRSVYRVVRALYGYRNHFIQWPTREEFLATAAAVERDWGFPGVGGFVDGSLIEIPTPAQDTEAYFCRKNFPALQLQVNVKFFI